MRRELPASLFLLHQHFRDFHGAIGADGAEEVDAGLWRADAAAVEGVDLGGEHGSCALYLLDAFTTASLTKVVEVPCTDHLVVVGEDLGLGEADAGLAVGAHLELKFVEVVALVEELNGRCGSIRSKHAVGHVQMDVQDQLVVMLI